MSGNSGDAGYRVLVCRGVSCSGFFADEVFRALRKEIGKKGLDARAQVERGGCFGGCGGGVTVIVRDAAGADAYDAFEETVCGAPSGTEATVVAGAGSANAPGSPQVVYPEVMETDVPRIVREHLQGGVPVEPLRVARRGAKTIR